MKALTWVVQAMVHTINALPPTAAVSPPLPVGPFLQTTLIAGIATILDLSTKEGSKYYEAASCSLHTTTEKFDVEPNGFQLFIDLLHTRAMDLGMFHPRGNVMIPLNPVMPHIGTHIDFI